MSPGAVGSLELGVSLVYVKIPIEGRPPRRDNAGKAARAASAPPN
jgi:hypothetical protein